MVHHTRKTKKVQKGGKVLGQGRDGCVVDPPLICSSTMSKLNKISKLINVTNASDDQYDAYVSEYKSGKIFRRVDPNYLHFLPGIDMCEISDSEKNVSAAMKRDIKKCGYKKPRVETYMLNIVMKKGEDFPKITQNLNEKDFLKSLAYIITGAKKCIYELKICLLDIKGPNLLYSKDDGHDDIYPVFIDFSDDFVIKSKGDFLNFIDNFGSKMLPYYDTWSFEILALFYAKFSAHNNINSNENSEMVDNYFEDVDRNRGIDMGSINGENMMNAVIDYVQKETKTLQGLLGVYNKIMMYSIGKTYYRAFINSKLKNNKNIQNILFGLMNEDIHYRYYADDAITEISKYISWRNRGEMLISLKSKTIKKKVDKALKVKQILAKEAKNINKSLPPLPSNLRMSPMTPLSFRQHMSVKKQKKIVKKKGLAPPGFGSPVVKGKKRVVVSKKSSKSVSTSCMKIKVADIKKSKKYKSLPKSAGKSKLKKAELCALLQKKTGKPVKSYSKMTKAQLLDIINKKKNCN